jgi:hypothetical protein
LTLTPRRKKKPETCKSRVIQETTTTTNKTSSTTTSTRYVQCPQCNKNIYVPLMEFHIAECSTICASNVASEREVFQLMYKDNQFSWNWHDYSQLSPFFIKRAKQQKLTDIKRQKGGHDCKDAIHPLQKHYYDCKLVLEEANRLCGHSMESYNLMIENSLSSNSQDVAINAIVFECEQNPTSIVENKQTKSNQESSQQQYNWNNRCPIRLKTESKAKFPIYLTLNSKEENRNFSWTLDKPKTLFSASFLKSLIQKCVRMCRPNSAVRAAKELIALDFMEFIRRIPVIMIEDSLLHPGYPIITWLLCATSKGYKPSLSDVNYCLQFVFEIAACEWKDFEWKIRDFNFAAQDLSEMINQKILKDLHPVEIALVKSIIVRSAFGGMHCDTVMLNSHANIWLNRFLKRVGFEIPGELMNQFSNAEHVPNLSRLDKQNLFPENNKERISPWLRFLAHVYSKYSTETITWHCVGALREKDLLLKAVDMHCSPIIENLLADKFIYEKCQEFMEKHSNLQPLSTSSDATAQQSYKQIMHDKISTLIWIFRSGPNAKQCISGVRIESEESKRLQSVLAPLWTELKSPLDHISMKYLLIKFPAGK